MVESQCFNWISIWYLFNQYATISKLTANFSLPSAYWEMKCHLCFISTFMCLLGTFLLICCHFSLHRKSSPLLWVYVLFLCFLDYVWRRFVHKFIIYFKILWHCVLLFKMFCLQIFLFYYLVCTLFCVSFIELNLKKWILDKEIWNGQYLTVFNETDKYTSIRCKPLI